MKLNYTNLTHPRVQAELMAAHKAAMKIARSLHKDSSRYGVAYAWVGKRVIKVSCLVDANNLPFFTVRDTSLASNEAQFMNNTIDLAMEHWSAGSTGTTGTTGKIAA